MSSQSRIEVETNRDISRTNRHACEVKGTLSINMAKQAQLELLKLLNDGFNSNINTMKRKLESMAAIVDDLGKTIDNSKTFFQSGGFEMKQRADDNASYEEGNLRRCIRNGKDPTSYKGINNFSPEVKTFTRLHFEDELASPPPLSN
jgi:hypothetical protein